jgi:hypothetical protein
MSEKQQIMWQRTGKVGQWNPLHVVFASFPYGQKDATDLNGKREPPIHAKVHCAAPPFGATLM